MFYNNVVKSPALKKLVPLVQIVEQKINYDQPGTENWTQRRRRPTAPCIQNVQMPEASKTENHVPNNTTKDNISTPPPKLMTRKCVSKTSKIKNHSSF